MKRHVFNPNCIFPRNLWCVFSFHFLFFDFGFYQLPNQRRSTKWKNFYPNEGKTSMIFHQPDLVYDSTTSYFFKVSRIIRRVHIVYVIESAAYGVLFTSCLYQKPEQARYERERAFDTNNEWIKPLYEALSMPWTVYYT